MFRLSMMISTFYSLKICHDGVCSRRIMPRVALIKDPFLTLSVFETFGLTMSDIIKNDCTKISTDSDSFFLSVF